MILRFTRILNYVNTLDILRDKSKINISKFRNKYLRDFAIKRTTICILISFTSNYLEYLSIFQET